MYMYVHACVTMSTWIVCVCVCVPCSPASWAFSSLPGSAHLTVVDLRRLSCFLLLPWNVSLVQWFQPTVTSSTLKSSVRVPYNSISPFSWNVSWVLYKNGFQVQTNREFRVNKRSADYTAPQPSYAKESLHLLRRVFICMGSLQGNTHARAPRVFSQLNPLCDTSQNIWRNWNFWEEFLYSSCDTQHMLCYIFISVFHFTFPTTYGKFQGKNKILAIYTGKWKSLRSDQIRSVAQ